MMEATNVVISSLINSRAFDLTEKFAYYPINYAAITIAISSYKDDLPAMVISARFVHV